MQTISATDLARKTREILDKVVNQGVSMGIERNHAMIAQIIPPQQNMTATLALAGLSLPMLTPTQAIAWLKDSKEELGDGERNPWE